MLPLVQNMLVLTGTKVTEEMIEELESVLLNFEYTRQSYRDWETDRKSTRLNSSHSRASRMPSSA